jgi:hypothetical protein
MTYRLGVFPETSLIPGEGIRQTSCMCLRYVMRAVNCKDCIAG